MRASEFNHGPRRLVMQVEAAGGLQETLGEDLALRREIRRIMLDKGWRQLGSGFFSLVFSKKGHDRVRKILAPEGELVRGAGEDVQSRFMTYVFARPDNPHLPHFYRTQRMRVGRLPINVYTMERLKRLTGDNLLIVDNIARAATSNLPLRELWQWLSERYTSKDPEYQRVYEHWPTFRQRYNGLYRTLKELRSRARQQDMTWDVYDAFSNIMQRSDGTPVVTDPWAP